MENGERTLEPPNLKSVGWLRMLSDFRLGVPCKRVLTTVRKDKTNRIDMLTKCCIEPRLAFPGIARTNVVVRRSSSLVCSRFCVVIEILYVLKPVENKKLFRHCTPHGRSCFKVPRRTSIWCTQKRVLSKVLMLTLFGSVTVFITAKYLPLVGNLCRELTLLYVHLICMLLFLSYNWYFVYLLYSSNLAS